MEKRIFKRTIIAIITISLIVGFILLVEQKYKGNNYKIANKEVAENKKERVEIREDNKYNEKKYNTKNETEQIDKDQTEKNNNKKFGSTDKKEVKLNNNNCEYKEKENKVEIEEYLGEEDIIIIPNTIDGNKIEKIDEEAFDECKNVEKILIPKELENINIELKYFKINEESENEQYIEYITTKEYSESYLKYMGLTEEERKKVEVIPCKFYVPVEETYTERAKELYGEIDVQAIPTSYDLRNTISIGVEDQNPYGICYAYAALTSVETNLALRKNKKVDLSEVHYAIMTEQYDGGTFIDHTSSYYASDIGPVNESDWPMEDVRNGSGTISASNIQIIDKILSR